MAVSSNLVCCFNHLHLNQQQQLHKKFFSLHFKWVNQCMQCFELKLDTLRKEKLLGLRL